MDAAAGGGELRCCLGDGLVAARVETLVGITRSCAGGDRLGLGSVHAASGGDSCKKRAREDERLYIEFIEGRVLEWKEAWWLVHEAAEVEESGLMEVIASLECRVVDFSRVSSPLAPGAVGACAEIGSISIGGGG